MYYILFSYSFFPQRKVKFKASNFLKYTYNLWGFLHFFVKILIHATLDMDYSCILLIRRLKSTISSSNQPFTLLLCYLTSHYI